MASGRTGNLTAAFPFQENVRAARISNLLTFKRKKRKTFHPKLTRQTPPSPRSSPLHHPLKSLEALTLPQPFINAGCWFCKLLPQTALFVTVRDFVIIIALPGDGNLSNP